MKTAFPDINEIAFEGPRSKSPLAFKHYDAGEIIAGRTSLRELEARILKKGDVAPNASGRQEFLENLINEYI